MINALYSNFGQTSKYTPFLFFEFYNPDLFLPKENNFLSFYADKHDFSYFIHTCRLTLPLDMTSFYVMDYLTGASLCFTIDECVRWDSLNLAC